MPRSMPITEAFSESLIAHPVYTWTLLIVAVQGIVSFALLWFFTAPYGRHVRAGWGPTMKARTVWVLMEAPSPIAFALIFFRSERALQPVPLFLAGLYLTHYSYRAFVYPFLMRGGDKAKPILMGALAIFFNSANGGTNAFAITELAPHLWDASWFSDPRFIVGLLLFVVGFAINHHSDALLRGLRKPGETGYKIPYGGFYRWVSSPNYFGELVEWFGFALAAWTVPAIVFALFTASNLIPRAFANHRWYIEHFSDYPKNRRRLIPFVL